MGETRGEAVPEVTIVVLNHRDPPRALQPAPKTSAYCVQEFWHERLVAQTATWVPEGLFPLKWSDTKYTRKVEPTRTREREDTNEKF